MATHGAMSGADLLMSHFVSAEIPRRSFNLAQIELFEAARAAFPHFRLARQFVGYVPGPRPIHDLGRPGYALYGGNPTPGGANPMRPVVTLTVPDPADPPIETGETRGYNALWTAKRPSRLATLLIGYADGLPRGVGATDSKPGAEVAIAGAGAAGGPLSMDLHRRRHRSAGRPGSAGTLWSCSANDPPRRLRIPQRHDRLPSADQPGPPLSASLCPLGSRRSAGPTGARLRGFDRSRRIA